MPSTATTCAATNAPLASNHGRKAAKIFGSGSRNTVAILILVKGAKNPATKCTLRYRDIGDYLSREDKLRILTAQDLETVPWEEIFPVPTATGSTSVMSDSSSSSRSETRKRRW